MFAKEFFIQKNFSHREAITNWKKQKMQIGVAI
jgi:hypothetical protein